VLRIGGPTIDPAFLWPLFILALGYTVLFFWLWLLRMQTEIFQRRARALMMAKGA
jgi:heme exporter protein C